MGLESFQYFWVITVVLAGAGAISLRSWAVKKPRPKLEPTFFFSCLLFPVAIAAHGALHAADANFRPHPTSWIAPYVIWPLLMGQLLISAWFVVKTARGTKALLSVVLISIFLYSLSTALIAGMAVSGRWL